VSQQLPYVLIRKDRPPTRYASLEAAQIPHDAQRFNMTGGAPVDAVIRGPEGMGWRCGRMRWDQWIRDDMAGRPTPVESEPEEEGQTDA
jgi:hypothetical protein